MKLADEAPQAPCIGAAGKNHAFCRWATERVSEKWPQAIFPMD